VASTSLEALDLKLTAPRRVVVARLSEKISLMFRIQCSAEYTVISSPWKHFNSFPYYEYTMLHVM
jgi:hypothetical protein